MLQADNIGRGQVEKVGRVFVIDAPLSEDLKRYFGAILVACFPVGQRDHANGLCRAHGLSLQPRDASCQVMRERSDPALARGISRNK